MSIPGSLNPMYGKQHTKEDKELMRYSKKKYSNGVGIYDIHNNLINSFDYATDLASHLNISKVNLSKYLNKGLVYNKIYYFKVNNKD